MKTGDDYATIHKGGWNMQLYEEYKLSRKNVMTFIRQHSKRIKELPPIDKQTEAEKELRGILKIQLSLAYGMKSDLEYSIKMLEEYLPLNERKFSNREHANIVRKRIDIRSLDGIHPDGELLFPTKIEDKAFDRMLAIDITDDIIACTTERQRAMFLGRVLFNRTQDELACIFNITQPAIHKHIRTACENLKQHLSAKYDIKTSQDIEIAPIQISKLISQKYIKKLQKVI